MNDNSEWEMFYKTIVLALCIICGGHLVGGEESEEPELYEVLMRELDERGWKELCGGQSPPRNGREHWFKEYVPEGQDENNYTDMITMSIFKFQHHLPESASEFLEMVKLNTFSRYPPETVIWNVIEVEGRDAIYEWQRLARHAFTPVHEVIRISLRGDSDILQIIYTDRKPPMDPAKRLKWLHLLGTSN